MYLRHYEKDYTSPETFLLLPRFWHFFSVGSSLLNCPYQQQRKVTLLLGCPTNSTNISAALGRSATGTIAGTVTDMAGNPVANQTVRLYTFVDDPMGGSGWQIVQSVSTDASGIYTFTGNVYLNVGYKCRFTNSFGSSSAPYMTEYFDNVGTLDAADLP